ncbi:MAG: hypothetical protein SFU55_05890 [Methylophilus sp.]|nr:hypothetical protein [Methylophilus sp.]
MSISATVIKPLVIGTLLLAVFSGASEHALADNREALKDAIGHSANVVEVKPVPKSAPTIDYALMSTEFDQLDDNHDEKISFREAVRNKIFSKEFINADVDHDSMVSQDEFAYYRTKLASKSFDGVKTVSP